MAYPKTFQSELCKLFFPANFGGAPSNSQFFWPAGGIVGLCPPLPIAVTAGIVLTKGGCNSALAVGEGGTLSLG